VGKTFLARELAVLLGVLCNLRVLLIDADMNCGDIATVMKLSCDRGGLYKLAQLFHSNQASLSSLMLSQCVTPYVAGNRQTHLQVLTGAYRMSMAGDPMFTGDRGMRFANALIDLVDSMTWDFVIFDLGQSFHHPMHLVPLRRNDLNLVIANSEKTTSIELMYAIPELTKRVQISPQRFNLVMNAWDEALGIDAKELVRSLNMPQFARIPFEEARECHLSMNQSRPLVLDPPCAVSNAIAKAAIGIYPAVETMWASRGGNAKAKRLGLGLKFGLKRA
jgi:MinD-like ATPase involved in chromosome partitioning or flagellar assembly